MIGCEPKAITFDFCKKYVDGYIQVTEEEIKQAKNIVVILSGANVGVDIIRKVVCGKKN